MVKPTLLMTRPKDAARDFVGQLSRDVLAALKIIYAPLLEITATGETISADLDHPVIFSSANAVHFAGTGAGRVAFCVGQQTALAARKANWKVTETFLTADLLVESLIESGFQGPVTHIAGTHRRGDILARLISHGISADLQILYDARPVPLTDEAICALTDVTILPVFSPRTASLLMQQNVELKNIHAVALSKAVEAPLRQGGFAGIYVSTLPTRESMVELVETVAGRLALP